MKIAINSYSYGGRALDSLAGMLEAVKSASEAGFQGFELTDGKWADEPHAATQIGQAITNAGMSPVCLCTGADILRQDPARELDRILSRLDLALRLGVPMLRHDLSSGLPGKTSDVDFYSAMPRLADFAASVADRAKALGLVTLTENHGCFSQDALRVSRLAAAVNRDNFGLLTDLGNFMCADENPPDSVKICLPFIRHVHIKDFRLFNENPDGRRMFRTRAGRFLEGCVPGEGEAHTAESLRILRAYGYDGWLSLEYEGNGERNACVRRGLAAVNTMLSEIK